MKEKINFKGKIVTYGINKTKDSYSKKENFSVDNAYCPKCHKKLVYYYYHYGHMVLIIAKTVTLKEEILIIQQLKLI